MQQILDFEPRHAEAYAALNYAWLDKLGFLIEAKDRSQLDDPVGQILDPGGHLLIAEDDGRLVGCCALIPHGDDELELAKMAVAESHRGRGLGARLLEVALQRAQEHGAARVVLSTHSSLRAAYRMYQRAGFVDVPVVNPGYEIVDVAMALEFDR